jgi:hypothetical protein
MLFPSTIVSPHHLEQEAGRIKELFSQKETEGTWKSFDAALLQFKSWLKQGCGNMENLLPVVRKHLVNSIILAVSYIIHIILEFSNGSENKDALGAIQTLGDWLRGCRGTGY